MAEVYEGKSRLEVSILFYLRNDVHGIDERGLYNNINFAQNVRKKVIKKTVVNLNFLRRFYKKKSLKFDENPSSRTRVFHVDRQTDVMKLVVAFRCSASGP